MEQHEPQLIGPSIDVVMRSLEHEDLEALLNDLLRDSDTICRKNVRALQERIQTDFARLLREEMRKTPDLPDSKAREEAEWRLRDVRQNMREHLIVFAVHQEELRRQRDNGIRDWVRKKLEEMAVQS